MSVSGWATRGGSELGTNRYLPHGSDYYAMARNLEKYAIDGILMIGGWTGYRGGLSYTASDTLFRRLTSPSSACRSVSTTICPALNSVWVRIRRSTALSAPWTRSSGRLWPRAGRLSSK